MKILRMPSTTSKIGLSKSAIYDRLDKNSPRHDQTFPRPILLGNGKNSPIGFVESELDNWLAQQIEKRDAK
jgi:prophage regulatory protein